MTTRSDFVEYNRFKTRVARQIDEEIQTGNDPSRLIELIKLQRHNFPTKEQATSEAQAFFKAEEAIRNIEGF